MDAVKAACRPSVLLIILLAAAFFGAAAGRSGEEKKTLYVYAWEGFADPGVIADFERKYGCYVEVEYYDSVDIMYERIKNGGSGYDVLLTNTAIARTLHERGLVLELDHGRIPNLSHLRSRLSAAFPDAEHRYSVLYGIFVGCVGYNEKLVPKELLGSWDIFDNAGYKGRAALLPDMRFAMGAALKSLGFSVNSTDPCEIEAAGKVLKGWKGSVSVFAVDEARDALRRGELAFIQTFHGAFLSLRRENPDLSFFIPEEGSLMAGRCFVVSGDTEEVGLAHAFIDFLLEPFNAAETMRTGMFYMPHPGARELLYPDPDDDPFLRIPVEVIRGCEVLRVVGGVDRVYDSVWMDVLLGGEVVSRK